MLGKVISQGVWQPCPSLVAHLIIPRPSQMFTKLTTNIGQLSANYMYPITGPVVKSEKIGLHFFEEQIWLHSID